MLFKKSLLRVSHNDHQGADRLGQLWGRIFFVSGRCKFRATTVSDYSPSRSYSHKKKSLIYRRYWINLCWISKWHSIKTNSFSPHVQPSHVSWFLPDQPANKLSSLTGDNYAFSYWMLSFMLVCFFLEGEGVDSFFFFFGLTHKRKQRCQKRGFMNSLHWADKVTAK